MPLPRSAFPCCCVVSKRVKIIVQVQVHNDHIYRELSLLHSRTQMVPGMNTGHLKPDRKCLVTLKVCTAHCCALHAYCCARHDHYRIQQQDCHLSFSFCYFFKKKHQNLPRVSSSGSEGALPIFFEILQNIIDSAKHL